MSQKIEISHKTIIFTVLFVIFLWVMYMIRDIILQFFLALLITAVLNPLVTRLSRYKVPRAASVFIAYILILSVLSFVVAAFVPTLVDQTTAFITNLPRFMGNIGISSIISDQIVQQFLTQLGSLPAQAARLTLSLFSNILGVVAILVLAFYLLSEREKLEDQLGLLLGDKKREELVKIMSSLETKLGSWAIGQLTLMFVVGFATYIGLRLLGIPFSVPLAILAGIFEIIPYIGPIISAIPAVIIGFGLSPLLGIAVASLYFLVQQLENYLFVPKIMQRSTGVHPVITLTALAIGFRLAGIVGLFIAVPLYITFQVLSKKYLLKEE
jgi:predicted PurR-regulated permease PerM